MSSSKGDDAAADGTGAKPYRSIAKALQAAKQGGKKRVYVCAEQYDGAIQAETGISIFGGLDCSDLASWQVSTKHATVKAMAGELAALKVQAGTAGVWIGEVDFVGADADVPGGSSVGAYVENAGVKLERLVITAGKGKAGAAPEAKPAKAANGTQGNPGKDAVCGAGAPDTQLGALPVSSCGGDTSGGAGGTAYLNGDGTSGTGGKPSYLAQPPADGAPGVGAVGGGAACTSGHDGAPGTAGDGGTGGKSIGTFVSGAYVPSDGSSGFAGKPGQGGGGGGASAGATGCIGASGGGGGSGGCGGKEGAGGKGGGASLALVVIESTDAVVVKDVTLVSSDGGDGAQGQQGGDGGENGPGGAAGFGNSGGGVAKSCMGGAGGVGGKAGGGGGGGGGPSIALLFSGKDPQTTVGSANVITSLGTAGKGGLGAEPLGTAGEPGLAEASHGI